MGGPTSPNTTWRWRFRPPLISSKQPRLLGKRSHSSCLRSAAGSDGQLQRLASAMPRASSPSRCHAVLLRCGGCSGQGTLQCLHYGADLFLGVWIWGLPPGRRDATLHAPSWKKGLAQILACSRHSETPPQPQGASKRTEHD